MSVFTDPELAYLTGERRLARLATVGKEGMLASTRRGSSRGASMASAARVR
jgi:hypothetical protein